MMDHGRCHGSFRIILPPGRFIPLVFANKQQNPSFRAKKKSEISMKVILPIKNPGSNEPG
jgi:hypothetical protein